MSTPSTHRCRRRAFLAATAGGMAALAGCSSRSAVPTTPAEPTGGVHGRLVGPADVPLPAGSIEALARTDTTVERGRAVTDDEGYFALEHPVDPPYDVTVTFRKTSVGVDDGLPILAHLLVREPIEASEALLGHLEVPQGHFTQVRLVDSAGSPVGNFDPVRVYSPLAMSGFGVEAFTTTEDGDLIATDAEEPGIALPGRDEFGVVLTACSATAGHVELGDVDGSADGTVTVEVPDPGQF